MRAVAIGVVAAISSGMVFGDTYTLEKMTFGGDHETVMRQYQQGNNHRTESVDGSGRKMIAISRFENNRTVMYQLDPDAKQYKTLAREPDFLMSLAQAIMRYPQPADTKAHGAGKRVDIYYETIDTGETKPAFGAIAKHIIQRERRVAEAGACQPSFENEVDGWYIPAEPDAPGRKGAIAFVTINQSMGLRFNCKDEIVVHGQRKFPGFPIQENRKGFSREILERSTAALDKSLFEIPADYRKVESLPGDPPEPDRLTQEWNFLGQAIESWFR